jgi:acyl carrier protein
MADDLESFRTEVRTLLAATFGISVSDIPTYATPDNTPGWDSLSHLRIIEELERRYSISIPHSDAITLLGDAEIASYLFANRSRR